MLTSDLVRATVRKGRVYPSSIDPKKPELHALAETLIAIFNQHRGNPRHRLDTELKDFLASGTAFLLHRGLAKLLHDRCEFATDSPVEPEALRREVFRCAAEAYREKNRVRVDHPTVLERVANRNELDVELTPESIEHSLYADLKDSQILVEFKSCKPDWLLKRYNVSVVQAVLLRATSLDIEIGGESASRYREIFRKIKFLQLLHEVRQTAPDTYNIHLDGPLALFRSSQRYGLQLAQFFPSILHCARWSLEANVLWGPKRRPVRLLMDETSGLEPSTSSKGQWTPREMSWLETQFEKLGSDWTISAESEILDLGAQGLLVPDYVFEHPESGTRATMEVLGYWRRGSLDTRLELLRRHGPKNLILALGKDLRVDDETAQDLPGEVYVFRNNPVAREVLKILNKIRKS